jgi:hypothetical protein
MAMMAWQVLEVTEPFTIVDSVPPIDQNGHLQMPVSGGPVVHQTSIVHGPMHTESM